MIAATLRCLLFKMPPTKWLVSHCQRRALISATTKPLPHTKTASLPFCTGLCSVQMQSARLIKEMRGKRQSWLYFSLLHFPFRFWGWTYIGLSGFYCIQQHFWVWCIGVYSRKRIGQLALSKGCKDWMLWLECTLTDWVYWREISLLEASIASKRDLPWNSFLLVIKAWGHCWTLLYSRISFVGQRA